MYRGVYTSVRTDARLGAAGVRLHVWRAELGRDRVVQLGRRSIWEFATGIVDSPHVTIPRSVSFVDVHGIEVHRAARLDAVGRDGFRVTHPMRTLLDLAPSP